MRDGNGRVRVHMVHPTSSFGDGWTELYIEDVDSGMPIVHLQLDHEEFWRLLGSTDVTVPAFIIRPEYRDRLGKELIVQSFPVPKTIQTTYRGEVTEQLAKWAEHVQLSEGWDDVEPRNTNEGWILVCRRYVSKEVEVKVN